MRFRSNHPTGGHLARILVIDDEEPVRHLLRLVLELAGHEVVLAEDGLRGLGVVRRQHPSVVILDVMMPVMDGGSVLDELQADEKTKDIPILILTAATVTSLRSRLLKSGAARVMTKPFDPSEVVAAVNELLVASELPGYPNPSAAAVRSTSHIPGQT
jgi:DNA-binding response OmpR family regulator